MPGRIAIIIPCHNEELTVGAVVRAFRNELPDAELYVFDNNSTDNTAEVAVEAGARVIAERRQGKGFVVQSMFRSVDADCYVMVDGDATYPSADVHRLIDPIMRDEADMVVGSRLAHDSRAGFRLLNHFGNFVVLWILNAMFRSRLTDILSGYRAFNRRFVASVPLFGGGFEIETELTIKAVKRGFRIMEIPIELKSRPAGSSSKIHLVRDGFLILNTMLALFRDYHPLTFFGTAGIGLVGLAAAGLVAALWGRDQARQALVIVSSGLGLGAMLSVAVGLILHSIARRSQELDHQIQMVNDRLLERRDDRAAGTET